MEAGRINIDGLPHLLTPELGGQVGLYIDGGLTARSYWVPQLDKVGIKYNGGKVVLIRTGVKEAGADQYWGIIFHEYGHGAMDSINRNGSGEKENNAWVVELLAIQQYITDNPTFRESAKAFVKARRQLAQYSSFQSDYADWGAAAYQAITGETWDGNITNTPAKVTNRFLPRPNA